MKRRQREEREKPQPALKKNCSFSFLFDESGVIISLSFPSGSALARPASRREEKPYAPGPFHARLSSRRVHELERRNVNPVFFVGD